MATLSEVASHLQMDVGSLSKMIDRGIVTKQARAQYDLDTVRKEYILHIREVAAGRFKAGELDLQVERARLAKEQADAKEMENAVERGDLVYIEDVAKQVEGQMTKVRTKLLAIPTKYAPELHAMATAREVQLALEEAITEALNELVGYNPQGAGEEAGD
jgi:phage terminase Nu1 subunit (DNA packaging protein)